MDNPKALNYEDGKFGWDWIKGPAQLLNPESKKPRVNFRGDEMALATLAEVIQSTMLREAAVIELRAADGSYYIFCVADTGTEDLRGPISRPLAQMGSLLNRLMHQFYQGALLQAHKLN